MVVQVAPSTATGGTVICGWTGRMATTASQPRDCCIRPDLTSKTFLLSPFSLSSFATLFSFLLPFFLMFFTCIPTQSPSLLPSYLLLLSSHLPPSPPGPALLPDYQKAYGPVNHSEEAAKEGPSSLHHARGGGIRRAPHVLELC